MESSQDTPAAIERAATPVAAARAQTRAGGKALSVLSVPLNLQVLQALSGRPMRLAELRKATGLPAQTTLRGHLANLSDIGLLTKRPTDHVPYAVENTLTGMGEEMLFVAGRLEAWLLQAPDGPIALESGAAKGAVKALIDGWGSRMLGALAKRPMSLTELDREIAELSYPALERRLSSMRIAGLVEACEGRGAGTPYGVTEWTRRGVAPLVAAGHCERVHMSRDTTPLSAVDIEAALLLALPLVRLRETVSGECQIEVRATPGLVAEPTGVRVALDRGEVVSCVSGLDATAPIRISGSAMDWFDAIKDDEPGRLDLDPGELPGALVSGLRLAFGG